VPAHPDAVGVTQDRARHRGCRRLGRARGRQPVAAESVRSCPLAADLQHAVTVFLADVADVVNRVSHISPSPSCLTYRMGIDATGL
jgi:hypothetical protein